MILPISQKYKDGTPNYFPEKIIKSLDLPEYKKMTLNDSLGDVIYPDSDEFMAGSCNPLFPHITKLHTFRHDEKNRWKVGMKIHFVINNRSKDQYTFAEAICKGIQEIVIIPSPTSISMMPDIVVDNRRLSYTERSTLITNDGFPETGLEHFNTWFPQIVFSGKIIHWTDLKY